RLHDELDRGSAEGAIEQVVDELRLRLLLRGLRNVHVGARRLVPGHELLVRHDLQELQDRRVAGRTLLLQLLLDLADGRGSPLPEDPQDLQLGGSGTGRRHGGKVVRRPSLCQRKSSYNTLEAELTQAFSGRERADLALQRAREDEARSERRRAWIAEGP